jgi:RNA polymerase sigma-70 factor (ECF subfamily)
MGDLPGGFTEDTLLVMKAVGGDTQAFGKLYERYCDNIYRFLRALLNDHHEAEDLTTEVFIKAWQSLPRYQERGHLFSSYLFRIARNAVIDHRRKSRHQIRSIDQVQIKTDEINSPGEVLEGAQEADILAECLRRLRESYRTVLLLRFMIGLPTAEVAEVMGRSEGAIRVLQHRALKQLRKYVENINQ